MSPSPVEEPEAEDEEEEEMEVSEDEEEVVYEEVSEEEEEEEEEEEQNPKQNLSVAESISRLQSLHGALSEFLSHHNALQQTLDSINSSIDAKSSNDSKTVKTNARTGDKRYTQLESICRNNNAKALRRYISTHLSHIDHLRKEVPKALKLASDPAKLVLKAMGKFYLQGSKAYRRGDPDVINIRRASILLLEFYVLAGFQEVPALVQKNARDAAIAWRSRLIMESGIESASAVDALGLTLLLASFGVPEEFRPKDLCSLLRLSNLKKKGDVLRRSPILVQKMPDIIKDLLAEGMHIEAVNLICAFGLEEKFPPLSLLISFVKKACEISVRERRDFQCSLQSLKESYKKELDALTSVNKCVEDHKLNASELADLKIDQKIAKCEKEIIKAERELQDKNRKRRYGDVEPLKNQDNQAKQPRPSAEASGSPLARSIRQTQKQGTAISDSRYAYNGCIANYMPPPSEASHGLVDRNGVRLLERNVHGPAGGWHGNSLNGELGGQSFPGTPYSLGHEFATYPAAAEQNVYQPPASGQNVYQPPASGQNVYQPPASGQNIYQPPASGQNVYQQPAPVQNVYQHPPSGQSLCQPHEPSLVIEGRNLYQFADSVSERELPNYPTTSNDLSLVIGGRNLYQFADSVSELEMPNYSSTSNALPTAANTLINPSHQSSYAR